MSDLIARLEAAAADEQQNLVLECLNLAYKHQWLPMRAYAVAVSWCMTGAYESAALTLVPEGYEWTIGLVNTRGFCSLGPEGTFTTTAEVDAATPALAICAAALKARSES